MLLNIILANSLPFPDAAPSYHEKNCRVADNDLERLHSLEKNMNQYRRDAVIPEKGYN
jgi:hypothetical protein